MVVTGFGAAGLACPEAQALPDGPQGGQRELTTDNVITVGTNTLRLPAIFLTALLSSLLTACLCWVRPPRLAASNGAYDKWAPLHEGKKAQVDVLGELNRYLAAARGNGNPDLAERAEPALGRQVGSRQRYRHRSVQNYAAGLTVQRDVDARSTGRGRVFCGRLELALHRYAVPQVDREAP